MINQNNSYSTLKNKHLSHNMFHITFNKIKISRDKLYFKKVSIISSDFKLHFWHSLFFPCPIKDLPLEFPIT